MTLRNLSVRERLIAEGVLVPKEDVVPRELESTKPVLRLDGAGAREARRAVAGMTQDETELKKTRRLAARDACRTKR